MQEQRSKKGFTMAELLIVVAIITALAGVSFIMVHRYQRSLVQLERNEIAKEIFVAAQNHLTMAESQGYLGRSSDDYGTQEASGDVYYYVVSGGTVAGAGQKMFPLMLPFGAIDETVRVGGSYILRYQVEKTSARMLDVYYMPLSGKYLATINPATAIGLADGKSPYDGNSVLGWYGGEEARNLILGDKLEKPSIEIENAEKLRIIVTDPNSEVVAPGGSGTKGTSNLKLIVKGETSGAMLEITLRSSGSYSPTTRTDFNDNTKYTVVLDDITTDGMHFSNIIATNGTFIPGEDITVEAIAYSLNYLTNIAYSGEASTNSLFAEVKKDASGNPVASITNIRHLENLDSRISDVSKVASGLVITDASQADDLDWREFCEAIAGKDGSASSVRIYSHDNSVRSSEGCFLPVSPTYELTYDGKRHSVSNVIVNESGDAGLFGSLDKADISDLKLVDFDISSSGSGNAGALAGALSNSAVENVLVINDAKTETENVSSASGAAGGLIGRAESTNVSKCAAAVYVASSSGSAGGLVGTASGGEIAYSYSGGHTEDGVYPSGSSAVYDVSSTSGAVGGLVGTTQNTAVSYSYSTCSAEGGANTGGLVGSASGNITGCYVTGLLPNGKGGAVVGNLATGNLTDCAYFEIINETTDEDGLISYLPPVGNKNTDVQAIDEDTESYEEFCGGESPADPYDSTLLDYYQAQYYLKSIAALSEGGGSADIKRTDFVYTHHGDWPAPEIFVLNTAS